MKYEESFKKRCVDLVVKEGRTKVSATKEFNLFQGIIKKWFDSYGSALSEQKLSNVN